MARRGTPKSCRRDCRRRGSLDTVGTLCRQRRRALCRALSTFFWRHFIHHQTVSRCGACACTHACADCAASFLVSSQSDRRLGRDRASQEALRHLTLSHDISRATPSAQGERAGRARRASAQGERAGRARRASAGTQRQRLEYSTSERRGGRWQDSWQRYRLPMGAPHAARRHRVRPRRFTRRPGRQRRGARGCARCFVVSWRGTG